MIAEYTEEKSQYYYRGTALIGYIGQDTQKYFYRKNAHGNIISVLDSTGKEIRSYEYDAFGKEKKDESLKPLGKNTFTQIQKRNADYDTNPFRYCGEYYDSETGNIYLRNRYYDSETGRFTQLDIAKDGLNWYVYCSNNPIMFVDTIGLYKLEVGKNANVYAVIEEGDTLSGIAYSEVGDSNSYAKMNYSGDPNKIYVGQKINITGIYNENYPNPFIRFPNTSIGSASNIYNSDNDSVEMLDTELVIGITAVLAPSIKYGVIAPFALNSNEKNVFPKNPDDFNPKGYTRRIFDTKNGKIYKWFDKKGNARYEWNEDLNHSPHYHYLPETGKGRIPNQAGNTHFYPGEIIPK